MCFKKKEEKEDEEAGKKLSSGAGGMVRWLKVFVKQACGMSLVPGASSTLERD